MNTSRYPRSMREAWGHYTGNNFDCEPLPRPSRLWLLVPALFALLFVASCIK